MSCLLGQSDISALAEHREYAENLWWTMHHSYHPGRQSYALTCYLDDSGSDDLSAVTTVGGPVMSRDAFIEFSCEWAKMLKPFRIEQPLHMSDFVGRGKHAAMFPEMKKALFYAVSEHIVRYKLYSLSISVRASDFNSLLTEDVKRYLIGPYGFVFFCSVLANRAFSTNNLFFAAERISYLVDTGFGGASQLVAAHAAILSKNAKANRTSFVGSLAFDSDERVPALQAADVIAWSARQQDLGRLTEEFSPLQRIIAQVEARPSKNMASSNVAVQTHAHLLLPKEAVSMFAKPINKWLSLGFVPQIDAILR